MGTGGGLWGRFHQSRDARRLTDHSRAAVGKAQLGGMHALPPVGKWRVLMGLNSDSEAHTPASAWRHL